MDNELQIKYNVRQKQEDAYSWNFQSLGVKLKFR